MADNRLEWNTDKIHDFYYKIEENDSFVIPEYYSVEHYLSAGIFCFLNVQMLNYGQMKSILNDFGTSSLKQLEVAFRGWLKK